MPCLTYLAKNRARAFFLVATAGIGILNAAGVVLSQEHLSGKVRGTDGSNHPITVANAGTPYRPLAAFEDVVVADDISDSYFALAMDVDGDGDADVVKSGLGVPAGSRGPNDPMKDELGEVCWYENPSWEKHTIAKLSVPVGLHHGDVDGDGFEDIIISDNYGLCIFDCKPENGRVSWLQNPGNAVGYEEEWRQHHIGNLMATHRLRFGYFSQPRTPEILALPVVGGTNGDVHEPIQVTLYRKPSDLFGAKNWPAEVVNDQLRVIHGVTIGKYLQSENSSLESAILASEEGLTWLYCGRNRRWQIQRLGAGEVEPAEGAHASWKGSGDIDVGRIGDDRLAYLVALEPFHGKTLAVYTKTTSNSLNSVRWKRHVLDTYGEPTPTTAEGPGHHVLTGDFDGDGDDEFIVGLRGPMPGRGVFYYKCVDVSKGEFTRQRISSVSASRIASADFDGDGRLDFCTVPYVVSTYFRAKDPRVMVYLNRFAAESNNPVLSGVKP